MSPPPGPRGGLFLGIFREFMRDRLSAVTRYAREYGDVVGFRIGPVRAALVSKPELIEEVLQTRAKSFQKGMNEQLVRPTTGNGILLSEGDFWKRQRRMVAPPLHKARIAGYADTMVGVAERVTDAFTDGESRDVYEDMTRIGLAIAARTLFDVDVEGEAAAFGTALTEMMSCVKARIDALVPLPDWVPTPTMLRLKRSGRKLDKVLYDAISQRRANPKSDREDLLSLLLASRDEDDGQGMTDQQLRDEAMTLFLAGFETSAINLAWTLHLIARHPEVAAKLEAEVDAVLGARPATVEDVPRLKYVERVVQEAMRLYPPAWIVDRIALEDLQLGGFDIKKGTDVWISPWILHRDPRFWERPDEFDPDRWENDLQKRLPKFVYFPFGGGPRVCIGNAFAMMEVVLVVSTLARKFHLVPDGAVPIPEPGFTLRPIPEVRLKLQRRRNLDRSTASM
jgi:cytochrome P450